MGFAGRERNDRWLHKIAEIGKSHPHQLPVRTRIEGDFLSRVIHGMGNHQILMQLRCRISRSMERSIDTSRPEPLGGCFASAEAISTVGTNTNRRLARLLSMKLRSRGKCSETGGALDKNHEKLTRHVRFSRQTRNATKAIAALLCRFLRHEGMSDFPPLRTNYRRTYDLHLLPVVAKLFATVEASDVGTRALTGATRSGPNGERKAVASMPTSEHGTHQFGKHLDRLHRS
jgi:hypothetical protein